MILAYISRWDMGCAQLEHAQLLNYTYSKYNKWEEKQ